MAQQIQLNVDDEVIAVGKAIKDLYADIKAGKTVLADVQDLANDLIAALASLTNLPADAKKVDNQVYLLSVVAGLFEPAAS